MNATAQQIPASNLEIDEALIFGWAQMHKDRIGAYPHPSAGPVMGPNGEKLGVTWSQINTEMFNGFNGLPPKLTLRSLIESYHRVFASLDESSILKWATVHKQKHNSFPTSTSGSIEHAEADGDSWENINSALTFGLRGLEGGRSLQEFLDEHTSSKQYLSVEKILAFADDYCTVHGSFPSATSDGLLEIPGLGAKRWKDIDRYLKNGQHGLDKRRPADDLYGFLARHRSINQLIHAKPMLSIKKVISFAIEHYKDSGSLPHPFSGTIAGTHSETWQGIETALRNGGRGFAGGSTLKDLLEEFFPKEIMQTPKLDDANDRSIGETAQDSDVQTKDGQSPSARGLTESKKPKTVSAKLSLERVLGWFDKHKASEGYFPVPSDEKIPGGYGRSWTSLESELLNGAAGVDAMLTLAEFAAKYRPRVAVSTINRDVSIKPTEENQDATPRTTTAGQPAQRSIQTMPTADSLARSRPSLSGSRSSASKSKNDILTRINLTKWIDDYHLTHNEFPRINSGMIVGTPGISWKAVAAALKEGANDLPQCETLSQFIFEEYGMIGSKLVSTPRHSMRAR